MPTPTSQPTALKMDHVNPHLLLLLLTPEENRPVTRPLLICLERYNLCINKAASKDRPRDDSTQLQAPWRSSKELSSDHMSLRLISTQCMVQGSHRQAGEYVQ